MKKVLFIMGISVVAMAITMKYKMDKNTKVVKVHMLKDGTKYYEIDI